MRPPPSILLGTTTVLLTLLGWSSVPLFLRHFAESIDAWTSNGWRYGFSALLWLPLVVVGLARGWLPKGIFRAAIVPSVINAAGQVCFTWAHYQIDPGLLTFGLRTQLIFVAAGAWLLFPAERPIVTARSYLLGGTLLLGGTVGILLLGREPTTGTVPTGYVFGVVLAILSGLLFAAYGLAVRWYMHGVRPIYAFATICQYTGAAMIVLMLVFGDCGGATALDLPTDQFFYLLLSAVIGIAVGHVFYYISIASLGVAVTAGILQLQPFLVAMASLALFGERLSVGQWIGGCVAVAGAMLMLGTQRRMSRRERIPEDALGPAEGESGA
ncbi:MAG: DMT family transporter [Phycisphaerales bacterium]|nr:DMT family transporter [Phycisphaerales bacterium]